MDGVCSPCGIRAGCYCLSNHVLQVLTFMYISHRWRGSGYLLLMKELLDSMPVVQGKNDSCGQRVPSNSQHCMRLLAQNGDGLGKAEIGRSMRLIELHFSPHESRGGDLPQRSSDCVPCSR
jgi:hypothetical protein